MTLGAESPEAKAVHDALGHRARPWDSLDEAEREFCASVAAAVLAAAVPTDGKTLSREFDEDGRALCFQCGEPQSAHPDGEECEGREYARGFAAGRAAATPDPPDELVSRARYAAHLAAATPNYALDDDDKGSVTHDPDRAVEDAVTAIVRVLNRTMDLTARERATAVLAAVSAEKPETDT